MHFSADTLDDLMNNVFKTLLKCPFDIKTSRGITCEVFGIILELKNPRARLSRTETRGKTFSALGEFLWYLSRKNELDFIKYYIPHYKKESDDGKTIYGGYGTRLFNFIRKDGPDFLSFFNRRYNQIDTVIDLLKRKPTTRRAVIQLFDVSDIVKKRKEIPCTCTLQFVIRDNRLCMYTSMRSNDAFYGLPHDIFCFTMLQEIVARALNVELGSYHHSVASLHLYEDKKGIVEEYLNEGFQSTLDYMPSMPLGDPWGAISTVLMYEEKIRNNKLKDNQLNTNIDSYWADIIRLLQIHSLAKKNDQEGIKFIQESIKSDVYNTYINSKIDELEITN